MLLALLVAPGALADDINASAEAWEAQRFELRGGKIYRNRLEVSPTLFFRELGRQDLVDRIKQEQGSGVGAGVGLGVGGVVVGLAGWGSFVGFTVYAATNGNEDPSILEWAVPAGILSAFAGSCLCPVGLGSGALVAGLPYLEEKWPVEAAEMSKLVDEHNEKLRQRFGVKSAMRF